MPDEEPLPTGTVAYALGPVVTWAEIPGLCDELTALLRHHTAATVVCDVGAVTGPDMVTMEALVRLALTARRLGSRLHLHRAGGRLRELLTLTGLGDVLPLLAVEQVRQAEQRKQLLGVEERVETDDPPA